MKARKRIGILGGISHESTIEYYGLIQKKYYERTGDSYPEVVIFSLDFEKFTEFENTDKEQYIKYIMEGIRSLEKAGADFVIMAANSPHAVFDEVEKKSQIPVLSIVRATCEQALQQGLKTLLLLGIQFTMESSFYQDVFRDHGISIVTPSSKERTEIDRIIFDELVLGIHKKESKEKLLTIISNYEVDGVILGCTELPLVLNQKDITIPVLNTVEIHVETALDYLLL